MFDARKFLEVEFSNAPNVRALLASYGVKVPGLSAVEKWFQRGRISGEYLPLLLCVIEIEKGEPVRLAQYMRGA